MEYLKVDNNPDDLLRYQDIRNLIQTQIVDYLIYWKNPPPHQDMLQEANIWQQL